MSSILLVHRISVILFLLIYIVKTILLLTNQTNALTKLTKTFKVPEMVISFLFLATGVWMFIEIGAIKSMQIYKLIAVFLAIPIAIIGFKKQNKALALLSLLLIIASYGLAEMSRRQPYPYDLKVKVVADKPEGEMSKEELGAAVYNETCVSCHGPDGDRGFSGAAKLSTSKLAIEDIASIVKNGKNTMVPYKDILTKEQIEAVSEYVKKLQK